MNSAPVAFVLTFVAGPALALSCMAPDVATTFKEAAASEKTYVVVHGTLSFDEAELPDVDLNHQEEAPAYVDIQAHLTGKYLSEGAFNEAFDHPVTMHTLCYGPWCGSAVSGEEYLLFLEKSDDGFLFPVTPCGDYVFAKPSEEQLEQVTQCLKGGSCTP